MKDSSEPALQQVEAEPYVAARAGVSMDTFRSVVDSNFSRSFQWLAKEGLAPAGPPFIRYLSLDANGEPDRIELGVCVAHPGEPGDGLGGGEVPAGEYVIYTHVGPYIHAELEDLEDATDKVLAWARDQGIELSVSAREGGGQKLGASFEFYPVDPMSEDDFTKWETKIMMMTGA